ncbi:MAG: hypothetical protein GX337_09100 [Christensenellaceae bacterium]|nr:hypothetical protein [Christensenellaceae bacterium]
MIQYFCRRCQRPGPTPTCAACGKSIPASSVCNVWEMRALPIMQRENIFFVFRLMLSVVLLVFLAMLAIEFIFSSGVDSISIFLTSSGVLPQLLYLFFGGVVFCLIILLLQGDETVQCLIEPKGVLKRTWIKPSRLKCATRLIRFDKHNILLNAENIPFLLAHEEYLAFPDVKRYALYPRSQRVKLYRPYAFLFMYFKVPRDSWDEAADMIASKLKKLG